MRILQESTYVGVFFNKNAGPQNSNFIKKRLQHRFSPIKFANFLRTPCFTDHLQRVLLAVSGFQPATLLKKRLRQRCFSVNFAKLLWTSFVYLWTLRSFSERLFYRAPMGIHAQVAEFQPSNTIKNFFTSVFTGTRSSHSKAFIYLKFLKIIFEEVHL